jgi:hypothetical protein
LRVAARALRRSPAIWPRAARPARGVGFGAKVSAPPADGSPETAYASTYFPGTLDVAQAQKIDVAAGDYSDIYSTREEGR